VIYSRALMLENRYRVLVAVVSCEHSHSCYVRLILYMQVRKGGSLP